MAYCRDYVRVRCAFNANAGACAVPEECRLYPESDEPNYRLDRTTIAHAGTLLARPGHDPGWKLGRLRKIHG